MAILQYRADKNSPWLELQVIKGDKGEDGTVSFDELTQAQKDSLKGDVGPQGEQGPGATHSWNGTVLTITSASGTSSADLVGPKGADGTMTFSDLTEEQKASLKGEDGYTPKRGVDYWTTADKNEIINSVLASIPSTEEVNY